MGDVDNLVAWLQLITYLIGCVFVAGGVYVGIRKDLKHMHEKLDDNKERTREAKNEAERAHRRIDSIMTSRKQALEPQVER